MEQRPLEFDYKIILQNEVLILILAGKLGKESKSRLEACGQELKELNHKFAVIIFKDTSTVEMVIFRELILIQQELRKKSDLAIVGLNKQLRLYLNEKAVIRLHEVKNSLEEALKSNLQGK